MQRCTSVKFLFAGSKVYKGCKIDYSGKIVTAKLFLDVLTGEGQGKARGIDTTMCTCLMESLGCGTFPGTRDLLAGP